MELELLVRARIAELREEATRASRSQAIRRFLRTRDGAPVDGGYLLIPGRDAWLPASEARDPAA